MRDVSHYHVLRKRILLALRRLLELIPLNHPRRSIHRCLSLDEQSLLAAASLSETAVAVRTASDCRRLTWDRVGSQLTIVLLVHVLNGVVQVPRALIEALEPLARGGECAREHLILWRLELRVEYLQGAEGLGQGHILRVIAPGEVEQVEVLVFRSVDPFHSHKRHAAALCSRRLALNVIEIMQYFVLGIAHIGRVLHPVGLRGGAIVSEMLEVLYREGIRVYLPLLLRREQGCLLG